MKLVTKYISALIILLLCQQLVCLAQGPVKQMTKEDMVQAMLKEKCRKGAYKAEENNPLSKLSKTSGYDGRVSNTGSGYTEGEVSIVVCPTDSNRLIVSYMQENSSGLEFPIYYSSNGGATWAKSNFSPFGQLGNDFPGQTFSGGGDPTFAWDKNGKVYFAWIYLTLNPTQDTAFFSLHWAYSTDNGVTWKLENGANHFIGRGAIDPSNSNTYNYFDGITDREWLTIDNTNGPNQGNLYCSFVNFPPGTANASEAIKVKKVNDTAFGPMVSGFYGQTQFGNVEVDNGGVLHMSFADVNTEKMMHVASNNGGLSFGSANIVGSSTNLFPQSNHVVQYRENAAPNLATDGAGNLHVVWSDYPGGYVISYYSRSTDGGQHWSSPLVLDSLFNNQHTIMPTVAAFGNTVAISTTAYAGSTPDSANFYQVVSSDKGQTFSIPLKVSTVPTDYTVYANNQSAFFGDYFRSVQSHCETYATWSDGRNLLGPKIYFAKINNCTVTRGNTTGIAEISVINSGLQLESASPNPAKDVLTLRFSDVGTEDVTIEMCDMVGKKVLSQTNTLHKGVQDVTMKLNGMAPGVYILSVSANNGVVATRHIVVQ